MLNLLKPLVLICLIFVFNSSHAKKIECKEVTEVVKQFFTYHINTKMFDDTLEKRVISKFIENLDYRKIYFLKSDISELEMLGIGFPEKLKRGDCSYFKRINDSFNKRFNERLNYILSKLGKAYKYNKDVSIVSDSKKIDFPDSVEEANKRAMEYVDFQIGTYVMATSQVKNAKEGKAGKEATGKDKPVEANKDLEKVSDNKSLKSKGKGKEIAQAKKVKLDPKKEYQKSLDKVRKYYKELQTKFAKIRETLEADILKGIAGSLDPHSTYFTQEELEDFNIQTRLSLEGIGALLKYENEFTVIESMVPGGPTEKSGKIKHNDKIIAVAQEGKEPVSVIGLELPNVVRLIRGERGTKVVLTILRESANDTIRFNVTLVRDRISMEDQAAKSTVIENVEYSGKKVKLPTLGILKLRTFYLDFEGRSEHKTQYRSSSKDVLTELEKLKKSKVEGMILDLRDNGGGALDEAVSIAGAFIESGVVVSTRDFIGQTKQLWDKEERKNFDKPLIILTNRLSASASEIVAGALKDYGRAIIVGDESTFGKGSVQQIQQLPNGMGAIKITVGQFYTAGGASTQNKGVESDVVVPTHSNILPIGERELPFALDWDTIPTAIPKKKAEFQFGYKAHQELANVETARLGKKLSDLSKDRISKSKLFTELSKKLEKIKAKVKKGSYDLKSDQNQTDPNDVESSEELEANGNESDAASKKGDIKIDLELKEALFILRDYVFLSQGKQPPIVEAVN